MRLTIKGRWLTALVCAAGVSACGSDSDDSKWSVGGASGGSGTGSTPIFLGGGNGGGGSGSGSGNASGDSGTGPNECPQFVDQSGCVGEVYRGETIPLDIYVMFDQSGSMLNQEEGGVTRMDAVRSAVGEFLNDEGSRGLGVGIGYFGQQPIGATTCNPADYEAAGVPVAELPGNAQAIIDSLATREPTGETPSGAAIRGGCTYAKQWKTDHPGREVVFLLVTDGEPKAPVTCGDTGGGPCCPTLDDAVQAAVECSTGEPGLRTFVLGVGPFLENLGQIAQAGGTDNAYLVSGGDVAQQVVDALNDIRIAAQIPCELSIPSPTGSQDIDYSRVNVLRTSSSCTTEVVQPRETQAACDGAEGGWHYDDPAAPTKVVLCEKSCRDVGLPGEQLSFSIGCMQETPR